MDLKILEWNGSSGFDITGARHAIEEQGAFLLRGVLQPSEIETARHQVRGKLIAGGEPISLGHTQPNAAILAPEIDWVVGHPNIVAVFQKLFDSHAMFTGHCDIHMNMLSGWHKDSGEHVGGYFKGDYFAADECRVYKAAVYLQDATPKDGLTVSLGSHRRSDHSGETCWIPTKAGDVVFFDVRLSHTGQLPDVVENGIKAVSRIAPRADRHDPAWATALKSAYWKMIGRRDRLSLFFTYGSPNAYTVDFARANMIRQHQQAAVADDELPAAFVEDLRAQGVEVVDFV